MPGGGEPAHTSAVPSVAGTRRRSVFFVVLLAAAAACAVWTDSALALTRNQADRIALHALHPGRERGRVVVFGLDAPLEAGTSVVTGGPKQGATTTTVHTRPLARRTWIFWEDFSYDAEFPHPSRLLEISNATGRVIKRRRMGWVPLIDGKRPAFLSSHSGYRDARFQVFSNVPGSASAARTQPVSRTNPLAFRTAGSLSAHTAAGGALTSSDLTHDCLIIIGDHQDPAIDGTDANGNPQGDIPAMKTWAASVGLRTLEAKDVPELSTEVDALTSLTPCDDVMIFIAGHGLPAPGVTPTNLPPGRKMPTNIAGPAAISIHESVTVKENGKHVKQIDDWIHPSDLETIMKAHPRSSFKLKIMACFSGRFIDDLKGAVPNLELIETSSASNEVTFGEKKRHKASDGTVYYTQVFGTPLNR